MNGAEERWPGVARRFRLLLAGWLDRCIQTKAKCEMLGNYTALLLCSLRLSCSQAHSAYCFLHACMHAFNHVLAVSGIVIVDSSKVYGVMRTKFSQKVVQLEAPSSKLQQRMHRVHLARRRPEGEQGAGGRGGC